MHNFTPLSAVIGGLLIGATATLMLLLKGRLTGISGIVGGLIHPSHGDTSWRALFLIGLMSAPLLFRLVTGRLPEVLSTTSEGMLIVAGLLVGFGTRLGNGCTSGHGVCGVARRAPRSIVATLTFLFSAMLTVFLTRHIFHGGTP